MKHNSGKRKHRIPRRVIGLFLVIVLLAIGGTLWARHIYYQDIKPANSNDQKTQVVTIGEGSSTKEIGQQLQQDHLIRSAWAFELYVHSHETTDELQAGTYALSPSQTLAEIVNTINQGKVTTKLVTILPGKRIDQIKADLINDGFSPSSVTNALNPSLYTDLPVLAFKPASADTLEGMLWPDSFQKDPNTDPSVIIRESLTEMGQHLTPAIQTDFANEGLSTYQGLTLASIVNQEVSKASDQTQVAQVFLSRLKMGMPLGSDVTADYGSIIAGQQPNLNYDSPYNTLINKGLPPTPISTISASALNAVAHPANTSWLYFVTGDNGTTYFSTNLAQHQAYTQEYCHKLCSQ